MGAGPSRRPRRGVRRSPLALGAVARAFALLATVARAFALLATVAACARDERPPNVLLVVLDTTRADALSCYAGPPAATPHIDALAAEGTLFTRAFSTAFWTLPSHASLLTGRHPSEIGATSETNRLPPSARTLAEDLRAAGYRTAGVACNAWLSSRWGFEQGFEEYLEMWREALHPAPNATQVDIEREAARRAAGLIERYASRGEPFFVFVNFNIAHLPFTPPTKYRRRMTADRLATDELLRLMSVDGMWSHYAGETVLDEADYARLRELYLAEVALADEFVGRLVSALERTGALEQTLVVVTSDHGENIGDHGLVDHVLSMYDTTLHVPLVMRHPGLFPGPGAASERRDELVSLVDVAPTIRAACGVGTPSDAERSLAGTEPASRPFVLAENDRPVNAVQLLREQYPHVDVDAIDRPMRAIRTETHKLIWPLGAEPQLFDLVADPGELRDLAADEPELVESLSARIRAWMDAIPAPEIAAPAERAPDEESLERLRELGYVR